METSIYSQLFRSIGDNLGLVKVSVGCVLCEGRGLVGLSANLQELMLTPGSVRIQLVLLRLLGIEKTPYTNGDQKRQK